MDPGMNTLLKWAVENSETAKPASGAEEISPAQNRLDSAALNALLGGPSDADLMRSSMAAVLDPEIPLDQRAIAFDNLEQLVESIDNANNLQPLGLWEPLVAQLKSNEPSLRRMAAWCIGTAVQNNPKCQEQISELGAMATLAQLATSDPAADVRHKAIYALSSGVRNFPATFDQAMLVLPTELTGPKPVDTEKNTDMEYIDAIMSKLRENAKAQAE